MSEGEGMWVEGMAQIWRKDSKSMAQRWRKDGLMVRALASYQCARGRFRQVDHKWFQFGVRSHLMFRVFLRVLRFFSVFKSNVSKVLFTRIEEK